MDKPNQLERWQRLSAHVANGGQVAASDQHVVATITTEINEMDEEIAQTRRSLTPTTDRCQSYEPVRLPPQTCTLPALSRRDDRS